MKTNEIKNMVELLSVRSVSKAINDVWHDKFKICIAIDGINLDFETDFKDGKGIMHECLKIFPDNEYNYSKFESKYNRTPKEARKLYKD